MIKVKDVIEAMLPDMSPKVGQEMAKDMLRDVVRDGCEWSRIVQGREVTLYRDNNGNATLVFI